MTREERLAANEARFRELNEDVQPHRESTGEGRYICECADAGCVAWIEVALEDYRRARSNPLWFLVKPGHQVPDIETVLETHPAWMLVEKPPEVRHIVDR